mgnify:CR=1 FL=1
MGEGLRVCGYVRCGRSFEVPVRLTDFSRRPRLETYYACPYCFSRVSDVDGPEHELEHLQGGGFEVPEAKPSRKGVKPVLRDDDRDREVVAGCGHHVGFLKGRPRGEGFPDGCLTCPKIFECMG